MRPSLKMDFNEEDTDGFTDEGHEYRGHAKPKEISSENCAVAEVKPNSLHHVRDLKTAQLLFQAKADLNARDEFGNSPLHTAIRFEKHDVAEYFLSVGADVLCTNAKGETPLHTLCSLYIKKPYEGSLTRKLIEMGANVNSKDSQGRTPLHLAVMNGIEESRKTADILIKAGACVTSVDKQGMNPIHHFVKMYGATSEDYTEMVLEYIDLLVINESAANSKNAIGQTILHFAITNDASLQILEYLVEKGCIPTTEDGQRRSLLHCLVEREADDYADVLSFLLDKGLNINHPDIWGQTALHLAVEQEKLEFVQAMVECGADVNVRDSVGREPLHIAAERRDDICDFLVKMGANVNAQDKHLSTSLHLAAWNNSYKALAARALIKAGCDVELRDECGQTAEEVATIWSNLDFLQMMHEKDANKNFELEHEKQVLAKYGGKLLQLETFQEIIADSSEELLRLPGTLNEFLSCLISTPGTGKVLEDPETIKIQEAIDRFAKNVAKRIADGHPKMRCTLYHGGSSAEGTKTKFPDEFDYVVCFDELSENIYPEHQTEDTIESVLLIERLKKTHQVETVSENEGCCEETFCSSVSSYTRIFLQDHTTYDYSEFTELEMKVISNQTMSELFTQQLPNIVFDESFPKDKRLVTKDVNNNSEFTLLWKGSTYKDLNIEVDFVPAVHLPSWPADKFRIQSPLLGPDLLQLPCLAVPKMPSHYDPLEYLWRCSLCLVETGIMKRCLQRMRNSYIAAKSLVNSEAICPLVNFGDDDASKRDDSLSSDDDLFVNFGRILPSYILKMAFFHSIEEKATKDGLETVFGEPSQDTQRSQSDSDIATCEEVDPEIVKDIFMKCQEWLSNQFVPSFFNPKQNVMGSSMLEEKLDVKAQIFIKYILKLLNENHNSNNE